MITTDIIIVSYNDEVEIKKCIASIKEHCIDYNLIIEDNSPPRPNLGFTKSVNSGIEKGTAEFIWLINSDAIVLKGAQQALIDRFSYGKQVGICGSMQLDPKNPDIIKHGGTTSMLPGRHKGGLVSMGHCRFPEKQTWLNGASMMLRRAMVDKIGLMDENLFLLCSDSDYCLTARKAGYECWYVTDSRIFHKLNSSKTITEWHRKDMETFMKKWGIEQFPNGNFKFSELFAKLNLFP